MKYMLIAMLMFFTGCGTTDKVALRLTCEHGEVYFKYYTADSVSADTTITTKKYLTRQGFYEPRMKCIKDK